MVRLTPRLRLPMIAAAAMLAGCGPATASQGTVSDSGPSIPSTPTPTPPAASVEQLLTGRWSALPTAPIAPRAGGSVAWTGSELLVWGGEQGTLDETLYGDGAAYSPATGSWRLLPPAPLSARVDQATAWTGTEMIVWGGYDRQSSQGSQASADGAAYDPSTNSWRLLPPAPLSPRANSVAVWTGAAMVILGGQSGQDAGSSGETFGDGAAYDPTTGTWQTIPEPVEPDGHPVEWSAAVQAGDELIGWSEWQENKPDSSGLLQPSGGVDLFAYNERAGAWSAIPKAQNALPDAQQVLWTGDQAVVRGEPYNCGDCPGPWEPEVTDSYQPATNVWTQLPADPMPDGLLAWTGAALLSFDTTESGAIPPSTTDIAPGDASVYDPSAKAWQMLPAASFGCETWPPLSPLWTGRQVLIYCTPYDPDGQSGGASGAVFTAGGP